MKFNIFHFLDCVHMFELTPWLLLIDNCPFPIWTSCPDSRNVFIPPVSILLNVLPVEEPEHEVEQSSDLVAPHRPSEAVPTDLFKRPLIAQEDMQKKALRTARRDTPLSPPPLIIRGSDVVITEPPIAASGIAVFSDLRFTLPEDNNGVFVAYSGWSTFDQG